MLLHYKNKGILVVPYFVASVIGTAIAVGELRRRFGGPFAKMDFYSTMGIALLICAAWTYLTRNDYYRDRNGQKQKMDTPNEFFFLSMKVWACIFLGAAIIFLGNSVFKYFGVAPF